MNIRKIHSQDENDIEKFITLRKESILDDINHYNLMTYIDEEKDFSVAGYIKYDFLKNYFIIENENNFIAYGAYTQTWARNFQWNHNFTIWPIYVSPKYRWQQLWQKILSAIEMEILNNFSYENINLLLLVNSENFSAIWLYVKCGFEDRWTYKNYIQTREWKYFNVKIMQKNIFREKTK